MERHTITFILASASPRRRYLLTEIGATFEIVPSDVEEIFREDETPEEHVLRLSREKAESVARKRPGNWVLGADTIVFIDGDVLGKPETKDDARTMLCRLSGNDHIVLTGFALVTSGKGVVANELVRSTVTFREIPDDEIEWYIETDEPYDKAGAYAVQGIAGMFIRSIKGSYSNVIGLPLCEVTDALKKVGIIAYGNGK